MKTKSKKKTKIKFKFEKKNAAKETGSQHYYRLSRETHRVCGEPECVSERDVCTPLVYTKKYTPV